MTFGIHASRAQRQVNNGTSTSCHSALSTMPGARRNRTISRRTASVRMPAMRRMGYVCVLARSPGSEGEIRTARVVPRAVACPLPLLRAGLGGGRRVDAPGEDRGVPGVEQLNVVKGSGPVMPPIQAELNEYAD